VCCQRVVVDIAVVVVDIVVDIDVVALLVLVGVHQRDFRVLGLHKLNDMCETTWT